MRWSMGFMIMLSNSPDYVLCKFLNFGLFADSCSKLSAPRVTSFWLSSSFVFPNKFWRGSKTFGNGRGSNKSACGTWGREFLYNLSDLMVVKSSFCSLPLFNITSENLSTGVTEYWDPESPISHDGFGLQFSLPTIYSMGPRLFATIKDCWGSYCSE